MKLLFFLAMMLAIGTKTGGVYQPCPSGWSGHGTSCYKLMTSSKNWHSARSYCLSKSAHLATIPDWGTQYFIQSYVINNYLDENIWIGLNDLASENDWKWADSSSSSSYRNWKSGEPDNYRGQQHCAYFWSDNGGQWDDGACSSTYYFLCQKERCIQSLSGNSGLLLSPNYPKKYANEYLCKWTMKVEKGFVIKLVFFPPFQLEGSCSYDYVQVYDVTPEGERNLRHAWCGSSLPPVTISTTSTIELEFKTDGSNVYTGFSASWQKVVPTCGGSFGPNLENGLILSPNYPSPYENNESCTWTIEVDPGYVIKLIFQPPFDVMSSSGCVQDRVKVYDVHPNGQKTLKASYCGTNLPNEIISATSKIQVHFRSDGSNVGKGFSASWFKYVTTCGGYYTNIDRGLILSPNYPSPYGDGENCKWTVTVEQGFVLQLIFEPPFDLESGMPSCQYDSVKIFNVLPGGYRDLAGTWCGNFIPPIIMSSGSTIQVEFKTDGSGTRKGFSLSWLKVIRPCSEVLESRKGIVTSPDFPSSYPNNQNCRTDIRVPHGQFVSLEFNSTFDLGIKGDKSCNHDKIEIFDVFGNGSLISRGQWCGTSPPPAIKSFGSRLVVDFHSDYQNDSNGQGFQAFWEAVQDCGDTFHANRGYIMSYNYSGDYNHSQQNMTHSSNCTWEIVIAEGFHIQLDISYSNGISQCDSIDIIDYSVDGNLQNPRQSWCDIHAEHQVITSLSHKLRVVFNNDGPGGFFASWKSVCGEVFHKDKGNFSSPNYDTEYPPNLNCEWTIVGSKDRVIHLDFMPPFELEKSTNENVCNFDFVEVLDLVTPNGTLVSKGRFCGHELPPSLISTSSKMVIRFHADHDKSGKGFSVVWDTACGDVFTTNRGELKSPNFPANYPNNFYCRWEIQASKGHVIRLKFVSSFSLEENPGCNADYVQLYDYSDKGTLVNKGRYCGTDVPTVHYSATSRMVIVFHSDERKTSTGFHATWDSVCGEVFTAAKGTFSSPDYGLEYPPNLDCEWEIKAEINHVVHLYFNSPFELESTNDDKCGFDHVEVFDLIMPSRKLVSKGKFCGNNPPGPIVSSSTDMVVRFHSDKDKSEKGFSARWSTACGDVFRGNHGDIKSPGYPTGYPNDFDCRWEIYVTEGHVIKLSFKHPFGLEHNHRFVADFVEIFDISDKGDLISKGKWTGTEIPPVQKSTTSKMVVVFHSDDRINGAGFHIVWDSVCGEEFYGEKGKFSSPDYGRQYPANLDCEWEIQGVNKHHIHLVFQSPFELEASNDDNCSFDHVEVFDSMVNGTLVSKGRFCGHVLPPPITSSSSKVVVKFHSDRGKSGKGFFATWDTACGEIYTSNKGELMSPNYPKGYPNNFECRWEIRVEPGHVVELSFHPTFSIEDNTRFIADYVEVFDVSDKGDLNSKGKWSGTDVPPVQKSTTSKMVIVFHSDDRINGAGFKATWDSVCGDVYTTDQGHFTSPGYPLSYPNNLDCRWEITVSSGQRVRLQFDSSFDLESDRFQKCGYDHVKVVDYFSNDTSITRGSWCGVETPPEIISSKSKITVQFHSDAYINGKGFNVSWDSVGGCGGTFQTKDGYFMTPNYPIKYPENQNCRWTINPPDGTPFTLLFNPVFYLEQGSDCVWDYVQVLKDNKELGRWCGNNPPPPMTSDGKQMVVIFKSDKSNGGKGFFASWTTNQ